MGSHAQFVHFTCVYVVTNSVMFGGHRIYTSQATPLSKVFRSSLQQQWLRIESERLREHALTDLPAEVIRFVGRSQCLASKLLRGIRLLWRWGFRLGVYIFEENIYGPTTFRKMRQEKLKPSNNVIDWQRNWKLSLCFYLPLTIIRLLNFKSLHSRMQSTHHVLRSYMHIMMMLCQRRHIK